MILRQMNFYNNKPQNYCFYYCDPKLNVHLS